jgi:predicted SAM-dependent methyltransferase
MEKLKNQKSNIFLNLACGDVYIKNSNWINLDYYSSNSFVRSVDLLSRLPLKDGTVSAIYCSHFLEHIPIDKVDFFLSECYRVLKIKGIIRIITPNFLEMCNAYVKSVKKNLDNSEFLITEILDQLVRKKQGGNLQKLYNRYLDEKNEKMIKFVYKRNGKNLFKRTKYKKKNFILRVANKFFRMYIYIISFLYPSSFKNQNISFASVGENHQWLWDYYQLRYKLEKNNFSFIKKMSFKKTNIKNFPVKYLDSNVDGKPRKGAESLYLEAKKTF